MLRSRVLLLWRLLVLGVLVLSGIAPHDRVRVTRKEIHLSSHGAADPVLTERTLLDDRSARLGYYLILGTGAAGAADGADHLAALHQRNATARGDHIVQRGEVLEVAELHAALKDLGLAAVLGCGTGLVLGNRNRSELGPIHALERHEVGS